MDFSSLKLNVQLLSIYLPLSVDLNLPDIPSMTTIRPPSGTPNSDKMTNSVRLYLLFFFTCIAASLRFPTDLPSDVSSE